MSAPGRPGTSMRAGLGFALLARASVGGKARSAKGVHQ